METLSGEQKVNKIVLKIPKKEISFLTKIMEGYNHQGIVSTVDSKEGLVVIHHTPDTKSTVLEIIKNLPFVEKIIDNE